MAPALAAALGSLIFSTTSRAAESTQAGTADIDYTRRVMLPAGHSPGIRYAADPTAPAFFVTTEEFYTLNLSTGSFSDPIFYHYNTSVQVLPIGLSSYASVNNENYLTVLTPILFNAYDPSIDHLFQLGSTISLKASLFGLVSETFYATTVTGIFSYTFDGSLTYPISTTEKRLYTMPERLGMLQSLYVSTDQIATVHFQTSPSDRVQRIDLSTGTLLSDFSITGTTANSLTVDSEGNIYIGNNQGGANVYSATGTLPPITGRLIEVPSHSRAWRLRRWDRARVPARIQHGGGYVVTYAGQNHASGKKKSLTHIMQQVPHLNKWGTLTAMRISTFDFACLGLVFLPPFRSAGAGWRLFT